MRGKDETIGSLFSYVDLEELIPAKHPLRKIRQVVNAALASLDEEFDRLYAADGRPSIAPERLICAFRHIRSGVPATSGQRFRVSGDREMTLPRVGS